MPKPIVLRYRSTGDGGGSGNGNTGGSGGEGGIVHQNTPAETLKAELAKRNNDFNKLAEDLLADNARVRERRRQVEEENATLKGKAIPEGGIALTKEEAELWKVFKELGKPEEVKQKLEEYPTVSAELKGLKREKEMNRLAKIVGFRGSVLARLDKTEGGLEYIEKEELSDADDPDSEKVQRVYVKQGDKEIELTAFARRNWDEFMPSLQASTSGDDDGSGDERRSGRGMPFPEMGSGRGGNQNRDWLDNYHNSMYGQPKRDKTS